MEMMWLWLVALALIVVPVLVAWLRPGLLYAAAMRAERALAGLRTRALEADGIRYVYTDGGSGPPLVLLHGFTADKDNWTRVARFLTDRFRVIAPDLPGFGDSTRDPSLEYSVETQVVRLHAFIAALGLKRVHLGGSSMGGAIAAVYAARYPEQVETLWLLAPGGVITEEDSDMEQILFAAGPHPLIPADRAQFEQTLDFVFARRPFLPPPVRRHLAAVACRRRALYERIFAELLDGAGKAMRPPLNAVAPQLEVPTLIVWGERDRVLHPAGAARLGELLADATVIVMPGIGHLPMLEAPRETARRFLEFQRGATGKHDASGGRADGTGAKQSAKQQDDAI